MSTERRNFYIDGNTVREMEAAPQRRPQRDRREEEENRRIRRRKNAIRRNRERNMAMNPGYVVFLTICCVICAFAAVNIIRLQSDSTMYLKQIATLENQISDLSSENAETQKRLNTSVDLNQIKDIAINQLGMHYATEDQIVYYSVDKNDYMDQYEDIPEN